MGQDDVIDLMEASGCDQELKVCVACFNWTVGDVL